MPTALARYDFSVSVYTEDVAVPHCPRTLCKYWAGNRTRESPAADGLDWSLEQMTLEEEVALLRDALDHIARIANATRQQTRRLDWIASRAREALRGIPWNRDYLPEPKKQSMEEVHDLRRTMHMLVRACESENLAAISAAAEEARLKHPSLFRNRDDG